MAKSNQAQAPTSETPRISAELYCSMNKMTKLSALIFKKFANTRGTGAVKTVAEWDALKNELYKK